jgi:hypothetical protein
MVVLADLPSGTYVQVVFEERELVFDRRRVLAAGGQLRGHQEEGGRRGLRTRCDPAYYFSRLIVRLLTDTRVCATRKVIDQRAERALRRCHTLVFEHYLSVLARQQDEQ